jgi:hypothetical protein
LLASINTKRRSSTSNAEKLSRRLLLMEQWEIAGRINDAD